MINQHLLNITFLFSNFYFNIFIISSLNTLYYAAILTSNQLLIKSIRSLMGGDTHDISYYGKCMIGGSLACGLTHTAIVPLDVVKCRM